MAHESLATAIESVISMASVALSHDGATHAVLQHAITTDRDLMPSGYQDQYAVTFSGLYSDLSGVAVDDSVSAGGTAYRVASIVDDSFRVRRKLICREA